MVQFPDGFRWGVATAAYQIEGAVNEDGRGESIWDRFCATPGHIRNNESGALACDHYHRYRDDVQLMQALGVKSYRFSIAWPRIIPNGRGQVNARGLDFYERLVDTLLDAGIEPFATLYHWDLPQALQDEVGGWASRDTALAFADYAQAVARRLGDRVHHWITLNEPYVSAFLGHESGLHAPGIRDARTAWQASHHLLLAHGLAVPVLREHGDAQTRVGITLVLTPAYPATDTADDQRAAQLMDGKSNRWFLDPVFRGSYPADILALLDMSDLLPKMERGDAEIIARPLDFLGANYYTRLLAQQKPGGLPVDIEPVKPQAGEYTQMGWEVYPIGLYDLLLRLHEEYHIPQLYITENGAAFADTLGKDGRVRDSQRTEYLHEHFFQAQAAITEGVPLAGYFVWSLMDNFEWAYGYARRFGIVYVDYATQQRVIKDSGYWYKDVIAANGV
ncbi:MAG: GH1 family beta-glucosidase [Chloroflexota bacterium]|nr:GH1 family beta-glucosidase [Chloroflexota bacterium]